jgi:azurin
MSRPLLIASAVALILTACGPSPTPPAEAPAPVEASPAPAEAPPAETPAAPAPTAATGNKPAVVADCATTIESNDAMQYNADSITVPASCTTFTINLKHVGQLAANVMGHNVVVSRETDMAGIAAESAGAAPEFIKPGDPRVIAHTAMIGGGDTTSVSFDVAKIKDGGPYKFFCSFPGHLALMQGSLQVL